MQAAIAQILENAKDSIVTNIQSNGITASGRTERSFRVVTYDGGVMLVAGGENTAPIPTLEIGHDGKKLPSNFTEIIKQWIIDKGISYVSIQYKREPSDSWQPKYTPEERGLNALAGAIAWGKIAKVGTDRYINHINNIYSNVVPDTIQDVKTSIKEYFINSIKLN